MDECTKEERALFTSLSSPLKIQDFLDTLPINHEKKGETCYSPRLVLTERKAHCLEGAFLAAAALAYHGEPPLIMNLRTIPKDEDHAVALFRRDGYWGALSKTNHAVLRYRDPLYKNLRELALSYFHEYFMDKTGTKSLRAYSLPLDLRKVNTNWVTSDRPLWHIAYALRDQPHTPLVPASLKPHLRKASAFERRVGAHVEWKG